MAEAEPVTQIEGAFASALAKKSIEGPNPQTLHTNGWAVSIEIGEKNGETIILEEGGASVRWTGGLTQIPRTVRISTSGDTNFAHARFILGVNTLHDLDGSLGDEENLNAVSKIEFDEEGQLILSSSAQGNISESSHFIKLQNDGTIIKGQLYKRRFIDREKPTTTDIPARQSQNSPK